MRTPRVLVTTVTAALVISGCGASQETAPVDETPTPAASSPPPADSPSPSTPLSETTDPEGKGVLVDVTVDGDEIAPNGARIEAEVGEPVIVTVDADRAGELHVHSTPEQVIAFDQGSTQHELVIDQPGVVEVEEHDSGFVVLQLQVS